MKINLFILSLIIFLLNIQWNITAQSTTRFQKVHKILHMDQQEYNNILPTDSCYWIMGWGIDTLYPYLWTAFASKISLDGFILKRKELRHTKKKYGWPSGIFEYKNIISSAYFDAYDSIRIVNYNVAIDSIYESMSWGTENKSVNHIYSPSYRVDNQGNQFICAVNEGDTIKPDSEIQFIKINKDNEIVFLRRIYKSKMFYDILNNKIDQNGNLNIFGKIYLPVYKKNDDNSFKNILFKLDSNGTLLKTIISDRFTGGIYDVIEDEEGNYICSSSIPFHGGNLDGHPAIIKMDSLGKTLWSIIPDSSVLYGGWLFYSNMIRLIRTDQNNYTSLGGIIYNDSFNVLKPGFEYRTILLSFNTDGKVNWQRIFRLATEGGEGSNQMDMKSTMDGGYIISGRSSGYGELFKDGSVCFLIKTDSCGCIVPDCQRLVSSSDLNSGKEKAFVLFPSLVNQDQLFLQSRISSNTRSQWFLIDIHGQEILRKDIRLEQGVQYIIQIPKYIPNGDYIFRVSNNQFEQNEKIVLLR